MSIMVHSNPSGAVPHQVMLKDNSSLIYWVLITKAADYTLVIDLAGAGAHAQVYIFCLVDGTDTVRIKTVQNHISAHTTSQVLVQAALFERAVLHYTGTISIANGADQAHAIMYHKNILMSDTTRVQSVPSLQVLANNVTCKHGSAMGTLNADQLFYMQSRALPVTVAKKLLLTGFFAQLLHADSPQEIVDGLSQKIEGVLL